MWWYIWSQIGGRYAVVVYGSGDVCGVVVVYGNNYVSGLVVVYGSDEYGAAAT